MKSEQNVTSPAKLTQGSVPRLSLLPEYACPNVHHIINNISMRVCVCVA